MCVKEKHEIRDECAVVTGCGLEATSAGWQRKEETYVPDKLVCGEPGTVARDLTTHHGCLPPVQPKNPIFSHRLQQHINQQSQVATVGVVDEVVVVVHTSRIRSLGPEV